MSVVTLRLPKDQHQRLTAQALTENDIELRYRRMAATGSAERGLELLDTLDRFERDH